MSNKKITELDVRRLLGNVKFPPIINEIYNGKILDPIFKEELGYNYNKPDSIFNLDADVQLSYQTERFKPILEIGNSEIIAYDMQTNGFIKYFLEEGISDPTIFTWDGVFLEELTIWFENDLSEDHIHHLSDLLQLKYSRKIIQKFEEAENNNELSTFEEKEEWLLMICKQFDLIVK